ncbi:MAG: ABC transporter permease [Rectinemataceae bacterium]|jgi:spermidine/putrescine transport system permease protein
MKNGFNTFVRAWMIAVYAFLFCPLAVIVLMSFNRTDYGMLPFDFTFDWYRYLFTKSELFPATWLSLRLATFVALGSIVVGTMTSLGLQALPRKPAKRFEAVAQLPIVIPWLVQGIALLLLFNFLGIGRSYVSLYLGNLVVVLPYVIMMVAGRFAEADRSPEDAARTLGARPVRIFFDVTLPMLFPGILSGALMSFMVCFNAFCMQYYLAPFGVRTLPLEIFTLVRVGYKPDMNALATLLVLLSSALVLAMNRLGYSAKRIFG